MTTPLAQSPPLPCSPSSYVPYGPEWEAEIMKLPKKFLVPMLRKALTAQPPTELTAVLQNVVGVLDVMDLMDGLPGLSDKQREIFDAMKESIREAINDAFPEWDAYLKAVHEANSVIDKP